MTRLLAVLGLLTLTMIVLVAELVRRRKLKERHAAIWFVFSLAIAFGVVFPDNVTRLAQLLGFGLPANLVLVLGLVTLTFISLQLSIEVGRLRDLVERIATEVALLNLGATHSTQSSSEEEAHLDSQPEGPSG